MGYHLPPPHPGEILKPHITGTSKYYDLEQRLFKHDPFKASMVLI